MLKFGNKMTSSQIIILGFAGVILLGSLLLKLPISTQSGQSPTFSDALFTAVSAVCVTGLIVRDTATFWSPFGQAVILALIQIGGMGVVTVAAAITVISGRKIGLKQRSTMQEAIAAPRVGGIVRLTGFIIRTTIIIELIGTVILSAVFCRDMGIGRGIWYGLFHSISAFCNAGFDLMGAREQFSSLTYYASHPVVNTAVMALIVTGGIGFLMWEDITEKKHKLGRYRLQSRVILAVTAVLIVLPAVYFFFFEMQSVPAGKRIWMALFQSVTPRTAGFNTVDLNEFSESSLAVVIMLMLTGGAPGSTAGGMKVTTLAAMLSTAICVFRRDDHTNLFGRRIPDETIRNAATIVTMYLTMFLVGGCIISRTERLPLLTCLFETASAIGTVGLTLGITPSLSALSRYILIVLMYTGRVGGLTLIFSAVASTHGKTARLPQERLTVG